MKDRPSSLGAAATLHVVAFLILFFPSGVLGAEPVWFARDVALAEQVARIDFAVGGARFHIIVVRPDGAVQGIEQVSRPGESLYETRTDGAIWRGWAARVGLLGAVPRSAELVKPDLGDEVALLFRHNPLEASHSNALRGYSLFALPWHGLLATAALLGSILFGARRRQGDFPKRLLISFALVLAAGEAVVAHDHWRQVALADQNGKVAEYAARAGYLEKKAKGIGGDSWGRRGLDREYRVWIDYHFADKPLSADPDWLWAADADGKVRLKRVGGG